MMKPLTTELSETVSSVTLCMLRTTTYVLPSMLLVELWAAVPPPIKLPLITALPPTDTYTSPVIPAAWPSL